MYLLAAGHCSLISFHFRLHLLSFTCDKMYLSLFLGHPLQPRPCVSTAIVFWCFSRFIAKHFFSPFPFLFCLSLSSSAEYFGFNSSVSFQSVLFSLFPFPFFIGFLASVSNSFCSSQSFSFYLFCHAHPFSSAVPSLVTHSFLHADVLWGAIPFLSNAWLFCPVLPGSLHGNGKITRYILFRIFF